jgi:hypothetical protein
MGNVLPMRTELRYVTGMGKSIAHPARLCHQGPIAGDSQGGVPIFIGSHWDWRVDRLVGCRSLLALDF